MPAENLPAKTTGAPVIDQFASLSDVTCEVAVVLGTGRMSVRECLYLKAKTVIPLEQPAGGPNFPAFDDSVLYEIHVDNNGDTKEDLTYQFRFTTDTRNPESFLYNVGQITSLSDPDWNRPQTYSVTLVKGDKHGHGELLGSNIPTPPDNIGPRSTPNYDTLAAAAVTTLPNGIKVFAGQRDDAFFVDLGSIFDLAGLRPFPFNGLHIIPLPTDSGHDGVANFNTHTISMQIPTSQLVGSGNGIIGIYASASRQAIKILRHDGVENRAGDTTLHHNSAEARIACQFLVIVQGIPVTADFGE